jgi:hypothetical protein
METNNVRNGKLFYSESEKLLFWIPNYYTHGNGYVDNLIKNLKEGESVLREYVKDGDIFCDEIKQSRIYESKWYFGIKCEVCPDDAFKFGNDWTLFKWIAN